MTGNPELHSGRRAATRSSAFDQPRSSQLAPSITWPCCPSTTRGSFRKRRPHREPRVALGTSRSDVFFGLRSTPIQSADPPASPGRAARVQLGVPFAGAGLTGNPELHSGRRAATRSSAFDQPRFSQPTPGVARPCCPSTTRGSGRWRRPNREPRVALGTSRSDALFSLRSTPIQSTDPQRHLASLPEYNSGFRSQGPSSPGTPSCTRAVAQRRVLRLAINSDSVSRGCESN